MVTETISICAALVCTGALIANYISNKKEKRDEISIKEAMDLAQIPVVTFQEGDTKLNFLLDSGSTHSYISKSCAKLLVGTPIDIEGFEYTTSIGTDTVSKMIETVLEYKDLKFNTNLLVNDSLDSSFSNVKENCGVQLHGILGSDFLRKHKYVIDFSELIVYHKKK